MPWEAEASAPVEPHNQLCDRASFAIERVLTISFALRWSGMRLAGAAYADPHQGVDSCLRRTRFSGQYMETPAVVCKSAGLTHVEKNRMDTGLSGI